MDVRLAAPVECESQPHDDEDGENVMGQDAEQLIQAARSVASSSGLKSNIGKSRSEPLMNSTSSSAASATSRKSDSSSSRMPASRRRASLPPIWPSAQTAASRTWK